MHKSFGILFLLTGIFAISGGFYTWGDGYILSQSQLIKILIPLSDIIFTGPVSLLTGWGLLKKRNWGNHLAMFTSGVYVFGSVLVFVLLVWNKQFQWHLFVPALSGLTIGMTFLILQIRASIDL
jgi:hypothetical protein